MNESARDEVLQEAIETATHLLEKRGEFFPFAVAMTNNEEIRHIQAMMDDGRPKSDNIINYLIDEIRDGSSHDIYQCVGIVSSVNLSDTIAEKSSAAIRVHLDGIGMDAVVCYVPFALKGNVATLGEVIATKAAYGIFLR
jgi:hypothetical protein